MPESDDVQCKCGGGWIVVANAKSLVHLLCSRCPRQRIVNSKTSDSATRSPTVRNGPEPSPSPSPIREPGGPALVPSRDPMYGTRARGQARMPVPRTLPPPGRKRATKITLGPRVRVRRWKS